MRLAINFGLGSGISPQRLGKFWLSLIPAFLAAFVCTQSPAADTTSKQPAPKSSPSPPPYSPPPAQSSQQPSSYNFNLKATPAPITFGGGNSFVVPKTGGQTTPAYVPSPPPYTPPPVQNTYKPPVQSPNQPSSVNFNLNPAPAPITFGNGNGLNTATAVSTPAYMPLSPPKSPPPYSPPQPNPASQSSYNFNLNGTPAPITFGSGNGLNTTTAGSTPATAFPAPNPAVSSSRSVPVLYTAVAGQAPPPMSIAMPMPPPMSIAMPKLPPYSPPQSSPASQNGFNSTPNPVSPQVALGNGNGLSTTTAGATPAGPSKPSMNLAPPANNNMAGTTPMLNNSRVQWLKLSQLPQALNSVLTDVSKNYNLPLKLESYTDTKFGGLKVADYRITPDASIDLKGVAGTLKVLQKVDDASTLYSIYDNTKSEFESRGITGSSLINAWVAAPQSVVFAFQNPDAGIKALTEGFTSASAVSIRFASFGLVEVHGPEVEQWVNKLAK
jgi:hypothetical protein